MKPSIRCSELDRVLSCNGSLTLTRIVAPRKGDEGDEGTDIHANIAWRLVHELGATDNGFPNGFSYEPGKHITDWIVNFCFRTVQEGTPSDWSMECEVPLECEFGRFILTGHPDLVAINPDVTEFNIDDYKTGYNPVDIAESNWQLLGYAALLKSAYPTLKRGRIRIIQPRNYEDEGFPRVSEYTIENIDAAIAGLEQFVNKAIDNSMELNSGNKQCAWCIGCQCPALKEEQRLMKLKLTPELLANIKREPDDAALADWVITARTLNRPTEDAEKMLHERLDTVASIQSGTGVTITRKITKGSYSFPDMLKFIQEFRDLVPGDDALASVVTPSVTIVKDQIAEKLGVPKTGKAAVTAETLFDAKLRPFVTQGERKILQFT